MVKANAKNEALVQVPQKLLQNNNNKKKKKYGRPVAQWKTNKDVEEMKSNFSKDNIKHKLNEGKEKNIEQGNYYRREN